MKFKKVHTGSVATKSVTLHNKSKTASDVVSALQTTGQSFSIASNGCAAGIPPRGTCQIGVSFAPLAPGTNNGTLTFTDLSKSSSHLVKLNGVGVATPSPTATSTSTATPSPTATSTASATPSPTASATPTASPTPTATGVTPTATDRTATATATNTATPTVTPTPKPKPPQLTVAPKTVKFKKVHTGSVATKSVTLHNKSKTASDVVSALQTTGQSFSIASNGCAAGIPPRGTCQIGVSFAPAGARYEQRNAHLHRSIEEQKSPGEAQWGRCRDALLDALPYCHIDFELPPIRLEPDTDRHRRHADRDADRHPNRHHADCDSNGDAYVDDVRHADRDANRERDLLAHGDF